VPCARWKSPAWFDIVSRLSRGACAGLRPTEVVRSAPVPPSTKLDATVATRTIFEGTKTVKPPAGGAEDLARLLRVRARAPGRPRRRAPGGRPAVLPLVRRSGPARGGRRRGPDERDREPNPRKQERPDARDRPDGGGRPRPARTPRGRSSG